MKHTIKFFIILLLTASAAFSQENAVRSRSNNNTANISSGNQATITVPDEILNKLTKFFQTIVTLQIEDAFNSFLNDSPINQRKDQIINLMNEIKKANTLYGNIKSFEIVNAEAVGSSLLRIRYIGNHDRYPMRWIFTFYKKPDNTWIVTNIKFDDMSENFFQSE